MPTVSRVASLGRRLLTSNQQFRVGQTMNPRCFTATISRPATGAGHLVPGPSRPNQDAQS